MAGRYENTNLINNLFNVKEQEYVTKQVQDYSQVKLDTLNKAIDQRMSSSSDDTGGSSIVIYVVIGLILAAAATIFVLKKKKII